MNLFTTILNYMFGESLPPMKAQVASGPTSGEWKERRHNRTAQRQLPKAKVDLIQLADERSRERYDTMDGDIEQLKKMAAASRARKESLKAKST